MTTGRIIVTPNDPRDKVVLRMMVNGSFPLFAELGSSQADELLEKISWARAALHDKRMSDQGPLAVLEFSVVNPAWRGSPDIALEGPDADSIALGIRHSTYGWLTFVLPDKEARALGEWLVTTTTGKASGN
jgi:hypothetical protein